jgi:acyl-CoA dehydrogenase
MATLTSELLRPVDPALALALDEAALLRYAAAHVQGFPAPSPALALTQFGHGQSNPTYCLRAASSTDTRHYVLRKKPAGAILQSAHTVEREFQVLQIRKVISSRILCSMSIEHPLPNMKFLQELCILV